MKVTAGAFQQVNPEQAAQLYERVESWIEPAAETTSSISSAGPGAITLRLARRTRRATGIESSGEAVRCAEENALANGISNCRFVRADAGRAAVELARAGRRFDRLVFNPPRAGLTRSLVRAAARLAPRRAVYVSCDPATLAADLAWLQRRAARHRRRAVRHVPADVARRDGRPDRARLIPARARRPDRLGIPAS
jgi:23S rRNA (uracil1939-C5)-methyltransferase